MTTPKSQADFRTWLDEEIARAKEDYIESGKISMNSYGAGMDYGIHEGLRMARNYFTGEME